jgi:glycopeptide antibiotics resistance protein
MRKILGGLYLGALALILLWPVPVDQTGATSNLVNAILGWANATPGLGWLDYNFLESSANMLLFVPLGFLVCLTWPGVNHLWLTLTGAVVSLAAELLQLFVITQRVFSLDDVLHNSLGVAIGVALASWWSRTRMSQPTL